MENKSSWSAAIIATLVLHLIPSAQAQVQDEASRILNQAKRAATAVTGYLQAHQPSRFEVETLIRASDTDVSGLLKAKRYGFKTVSVPGNFKNFFNDVQIPVYQIYPDDQTALGRFSSQIKNRYDVDVFYSPVLLQVIGSEAFFAEGPGRPFLVLSTDAAVHDSLFNYANRHEAVHLKFWAYRMGIEPNFLPAAPVHMFYQSIVPPLQQSQERIHLGVINFEDLVATTENIKARAAVMLEAPSSVAQSALQYEISKSKEMTENAILAANKALQALRQGHSVRAVQPSTKLNGQHFSLDAPNFKMSLFLSAAEIQFCRTQCGPQLMAKLEKALALARFNQQFLHRFSKDAPDEALLKAAVEFQKLQLDFIGTL